MSDKTKDKCTGDHQGHLCVLVSNDEFEKVKTLADKPNFICFNCGRVANNKENLCNPMAI